MTKALQDAFEAASRLPEGKQDALASAILEELAVEKLWDDSLSSSIGVIERLADEALAEHRSGKTEPLDPDKL
jgi:hypothetical protein